MAAAASHYAATYFESSDEQCGIIVVRHSEVAPTIGAAAVSCLN
jgi:hypothetical protein